MSDTILLLADIENLLQSVTTQILGIASTDPKYNSMVRIAWPPVGAPAWKRDEDVVFIKINNPNDPITYQRDVTYENMDVDNANQKINYTRVHDVKWTIYGPNSYDNAEKIKNGLFMDTYREQFSAMNLYLITDVVPPLRFPELFNGQWWERVDFSARFNEAVTLSSTVPYIQTAEITTKGDS